MIILTVFAFLAGLATVLSPCTLPVLPVLLSVGVNQGRGRPIGVVLGLILSFTVFTLSLTALVQATSVSANALRSIAIAVIGAFGLVLLFPPLSDWFARRTAGIAELGSKVQMQSSKAGTGFWSGFIIGIALGLLWTPCAGPILASIIALIAMKAVSYQVVLLLFTYSVGAAIPMFLIIYGGQKVLFASQFFKRHSEGIRQLFGALMVVTALALATNLDVRFQQAVLDYFPAIEVENTAWVRNALMQLHPNQATSQLATYREGQLSSATKGAEMLPKISGVPELVGLSQWLNSPPLTMQELRGKVVLIDFWTYSCINCIRTLPYITKWYDTYKDNGFVVIGVHTPEFEFEKNPQNVADAIKRFQIHYPVALDNQYKTWQAFSNMYWPAHYLVDRDGIIRQIHFGEGKYQETENAIRELLGLSLLKKTEKPVIHRYQTPETYLGYKRASMYASDMQLKPDQVSLYAFKTPLEPDTVGLKGEWKLEPEYILAEGDDCVLELNFLAPRVFLVLGGTSVKPITVELDSRPLPKEYFTDDMNAVGGIAVDRSRMYAIVNLQGQHERHVLTLHIPKGIEAYAFTYGE